MGRTYSAAKIERKEEYYCLLVKCKSLWGERECLFVSLYTRARGYGKTIMFGLGLYMQNTERINVMYSICIVIDCLACQLHLKLRCAYTLYAATCIVTHAQISNSCTLNYTNAQFYLYFYFPIVNMF